MRAAIVHDTRITSPRNCSSDAVGRLLSECGPDGVGCGVSTIRLSEVRCPELRKFDCVVLPYETGEISEEVIAGLIAYQSIGGNVLFLGDIPHGGRWYPMRNYLAHRFHLTVCHDSFVVPDHGALPLTRFGAAVLGSGVQLSGGDSIRGRKIPALRVKAVPPDVARPVFAVAGDQELKLSHAVTVVEHRRKGILGSRLAVVGFNGGEPRENVDGSYHHEWSYEPGLLDVEWDGFRPLLRALVRYTADRGIRAALSFPPLLKRGAESPAMAHIKNTANDAAELCDFRVMHNDEAILELPSIEIKPGECVATPFNLGERPPGIYEYRVTFATDRSDPEDQTYRQYVEGAAPTRRGVYGFSTYRAFPEASVDSGFVDLCIEMKARGAEYVRANIPWEDIEPTPGRYDFRVPDAMLRIVREIGLSLQYWMFPTTRGSGLSDGGVPRWVLVERAIDRNGNPGYFPTLWSPFYRNSYFEMIDRFTARYADAPELDRFVLDFGDSDFPYGYYYYYNDKTLFDYSTIERDAFVRYLQENRHLSLTEVGLLFGQRYRDWAEVPVPLAERDTAAYRVYDDFRAWSIAEGIRTVLDICVTNAPDKTPPDPPGHGLGSMADLTAAACESKAAHWDDERPCSPALRHLHCAGPTWGGEPWQVGASFREMDPHLFSSLRYNASYLTVPGPDLGISGDDVAKTGYIRRRVAGAARPRPAIAILDRLVDRDWTSLSTVAIRLDNEVDLITSKHRYDLSCYELLFLPRPVYRADSRLGFPGTAVWPWDEEWYVHLGRSVKAGLVCVVGPCEAGSEAAALIRHHLLGGVDAFGETFECTAKYPPRLGGGHGRGLATTVVDVGEVLLADTDGRPLVVRRPVGAGAVILCGLGLGPGSFDEEHDGTTTSLGGHTLARLVNLLVSTAPRVRSGHLAVKKSLLQEGDREYLIALSGFPEMIHAEFDIRPRRDTRWAVDLSCGRRYTLSPQADGWFRLTLPLQPEVGVYLELHNEVYQ